MSDRMQLIQRFIGNMFRLVLLPLLFIALVWLIVWYFFLRDDKKVATPSAKPDSAQIAQDQKKKAAESGKVAKEDTTKPPAKPAEEPAKEPGKPAQEPAKPAQPSKPTTPVKPTPPTKAPATPTKPATPTTPPKAPATGQNLANTGPGEVAALFVVVSAASAGAYHYRLQRQVRT